MGGATIGKNLCVYLGKNLQKSTSSYLPYLSSLFLVDHKTRHRSLHLVVSLATSSAALQLSHPNWFLSVLAVRLQVSFGFPLLSFPLGAHVSDTFLSSSLSLWGHGLCTAIFSAEYFLLLSEFCYFPQFDVAYLIWPKHTDYPSFKASVLECVAIAVIF
jgi:hypothetical protein